MIHIRYLLFIFIGLILHSCKKDDPREVYDLTFPSDTYYVSEGNEIFLYINQGNQKYQLETADGSVIETRLDDSLWPAGGIYVTGLKKGDAKLTVKDMVTGQQTTLNIHVVDPYLLFRMSSLVPVIKVPPQMPEITRNKIRDEAKTYGTLQLDQIIILHRNATRQFFIFENKEDLHNGKIEHSGTYELYFSEGGKQQLTLYYADNEKTTSVSLLAESRYAREVLSAFSGNMEASAQSTGIKLASLVGNPDLQAESPAEYFDQYFLLKSDLTASFKSNYPDVEFVWLTQQAQLWPDFQNYGKIGDGILK